MARFDRRRQELVLRWVEIISRSNSEVAYQFASLVPDVLESMGEAAIEAWVIHATDVYDNRGPHAAVSALRDIEGYVNRSRSEACGATFDQLAGMLGLFIRGLSGRELKLETSEEMYTDTETVYLKPFLCRFSERRQNLSLYKATAVHLWAQTWFGTFRPPVVDALHGYPDPQRAARLFHALETLRLDACIGRDLPGIRREMDWLRTLSGEHALPPALAPFLAALHAPQATSQDSLEIRRELYAGPVPSPVCFQGCIFPERVLEASEARRSRDRQALHSPHARLLADSGRPPERREEAPRFSVARRETERREGFTPELRLDGRPVAPPDDVRAVMESIVQDLGEIPGDYLVPAGDDGYQTDHSATERAEDVWKGTYQEEGAFLYNEWDFRRAHYRKSWCVLRELDVHPQPGDFVARTLHKYSALVKHLRRSFEALRGEDRMLRRQRAGDDIDIDALVEGHADASSGLELTDALFLKGHKPERDIAVMFMVDMSGSTQGWINDAERESLVLLCEALETLGDRYAIYGFSGITRKRCELYRIKRFDEPYGDIVRQRIAGVTPQDYTRMGVVIRHLSRMLNEVQAKTRLLVTLSDGKPDDYDGYRGEYGIEDTRQALIEARRQGIHPFCITTDKEARDYPPHMYGAVNYVLVDDVAKLPAKVSDIYRRLTA